MVFASLLTFFTFRKALMLTYKNKQNISCAWLNLITKNQLRSPSNQTSVQVSEVVDV